MGKLYHETGDIRNSMKSFKKAIEVYEKSLGKEKFKNSVYYMRINLEIGTIYI